MKFGDDEAYVSMPSSYLEQIIIIIMDNAVKYTKEVNKYICIESSLQSGKVTIRVMIMEREYLKPIYHLFLIGFTELTKREVENKVETD